MSKYHSRKTCINGIKFDSKKEAERFLALMDMANRGEIGNLHLQEEFVLQNAFTTPDGEKIPAIKYRADFTYLRDGIKVAEDVKGMKTEVYKLKKKMAAEHAIQIKEV